MCPFTVWLAGLAAGLSRHVPVYIILVIIGWRCGLSLSDGWDSGRSVLVMCLFTLQWTSRVGDVSFHCLEWMNQNIQNLRQHLFETWKQYSYLWVCYFASVVLSVNIQQQDWTVNLSLSVSACSS